LLESELFGHVRGAFTGATRDHPGVFRAAEGGTVLLDEIGEMSMTMQPRLLRVLQEGELWPLGMDSPVPVDVRVIASTNRDLEAEVEAGRFRRDLYFRLVGMRLDLKPLRERMEDIPLLAEHLLERIASEPGMRPVRLSTDAIRELMRQSWRGNIRELEHVLRRSVLLTDGELLEPPHLALSPGIHSRREALREFDREIVEQALRATGGNRSAAARALGISRATIHRWIRRHGIEL
jgi:transcriptional regulator with GAF, ATPase, and Fis domain